MGGPLSIMPLSMAIFSPLTNWKELALISTRSLTSSRPLFISRPWTTTSMFVILCCKVGPTKKLEMSRNAPHSTSLAEKEASNASGYCLRNNPTSWLWTIDNGLLCITLLTMATLKLSTVCSNGRLITTSYRTWRTPKEESLSLSVKMTTSRKLLTVSKFKYNTTNNYSIDIWKACKDGDLDMVRIMIREGQNPSEPTVKLGNTPMHIAARNGHYLIVKLLIDMESPVTSTNKYGHTPR